MIFHQLEENTADGTQHVFTVEADNGDEAGYKVEDYLDRHMSGAMGMWRTISAIQCISPDNCPILSNSSITVHNI